MKRLFAILVVLCLFPLIVMAESPVYETVDDAAAYVLQCREAGETSFELTLSKDAFNAIKGDQDAFFTMTGIRTANVRPLSAKNRMTFSDVVFGEKIVVLDTMDAAFAEVARQLGQPTIELYCTAELYDYLMKDVTGFHMVLDKMMPLVELTIQSGILDFEIQSMQQKHLILLNVKKLYPGTELLLAIQNGTEDKLSGRLEETLTMARQVAEACLGETDLDTARAIHDWLCERIVYTSKDDTDDDDTAIGAILDGQANCDGYSDAFLLIGTLAGLEVRYQHGDSQPEWLGNFMDTSTHMWNLLKLDGTWRMVDVTWDDSDYGLFYTWFNIGEDRASLSHEWRRETTVEMLAVTDLTTRPANEYLISSESDIAAAIQDAVSNGFSYYSMFMSDGDNAANWHNEALKQVGNGSYLWNSKMHLLTILH